MIKMKLLFRVKLLILVLSLLNLMQSVAFGGTSKKEFTVDGPDRVCGRGRPVTYSTQLQNCSIDCLGNYWRYDCRNKWTCNPSILY
jgi:hypothetical protein